MISVALPCFNAQDSLEACLESLLAQSFEDFEVVAVNDGSTDRLWTCCATFRPGMGAFACSTDLTAAWCGP